MNFLQIKYFVSVADHKSFTKAASKLYVSQPAISKHIASLEEELGLKLFDRSGKSLRLTNAGDILYNDCKQLLTNFSELSHIAHQIRTQTILGKLTIGITHDMDILKVTGNAIPDFVNCYPNIDLNFVSGIAEKLKNKCINDELDCIFVFSHEADNLGGHIPIDSLKCFSSPQRFYYRKDIFTISSATTLSNLQALPYIIITESENNSQMIKTALNQLVDSGITPQKVIWADSVDSLILSVQCGLGIGVIGPTARLPDLPNTVCIDMPHAIGNIDIILCWKQSNNNAALVSFVEHLREYLSN